MATIRTEIVRLRARKRETRAWRAAAKRSDETLSEWIRVRLNVAAVPAPPVIPPTVGGEQLELETVTRRPAKRRAS